MTFEELRDGFARMSHDDKRRFMEEVGVDFCKESMSDSLFMQRMFPRCMEMMHNMPIDLRRRMAEMMREMGRTA